MKTKITYNSDSDFVKEFKKELKANNGYCPCALEKTPDTKCMCRDFREQAESGYCNCGLYYKEVAADEV